MKSKFKQHINYELVPKNINGKDFSYYKIYVGPRNYTGKYLKTTREPLRIRIK